jgi:hypothetical protein
MHRNVIAKLIVLIALTLSASFSLAAPILVPNHSFESPPTPFINVSIQSWQKTPKPDWYSESGGFTWTQLTGAFKNTATNSPDHIRNCDGTQAIWLFVVPEVGLFQDYNSMDLDDPEPTHAFDAKFEVGKSYHLTVGIIGTGGGMQTGATLELSLYYRDTASNRVTVAVTTVTNGPAVFSNNTQLVDFTVNAPTVLSQDAWAGENIGIMFLSTVTTNLQGGYWDLDHVRLLEGPVLLNPARANGQFHFTLLGEVGAEFEILSSTDIALPLSSWSSLGTLTNESGTTPFVDTNAHFDQRFYRARQLP